MNITDMDCVTMSYLLAAVLFGFGFFLILARQFKVNMSPHQYHHRWTLTNDVTDPEKDRSLTLFNNCEAVALGILLILLSIYLILQPGVLLAMYKVCKVE